MQNRSTIQRIHKFKWIHQETKQLLILSFGIRPRKKIGMLKSGKKDCRFGAHSSISKYDFCKIHLKSICFKLSLDQRIAPETDTPLICWVLTTVSGNLQAKMSQIQDLCLSGYTRCICLVKKNLVSHDVKKRFLLTTYII